MAGLIFWIIIFYFIYKFLKNNLVAPYTLLNQLFIVQTFSNVSNAYSTASLSIIRADKSGTNYIFGVKKDASLFSVKDIELIYKFAQNLHIHSIVLAVRTPISNTNSIYRKIKEYNIEIWDQQKLLALSKVNSSYDGSSNYNVLRTSDVSDDHCKIDSNSFDPIQENFVKTHSLLSGLFDKPDRL